MGTRPSAAPLSEQQLLKNCRKLAGLTLADLAKHTGSSLPPSPAHAKGWVGQQAELFLGATAGSKAEPDFINLGIELKTLPLNAKGQPQESTYVCHIQLMQLNQQHWENAWVNKKLQHVLWLPYEACKSIEYSKRRIGHAILWQPTQQQSRQLRHDWEEIMEKLCLGKQQELSAHCGQYLQVRPKAANARALTDAYDEQGYQCQTLPLGFYLRPDFTRSIVEQSYLK